MIAELQEQGFDLPDYPDNPQSDEEKDARARYDKVKGSAVNPVLREGNSDRRAPASVKQYARNHPHSMGAWSPDSRPTSRTWRPTTSAPARSPPSSRRRARCGSSSSATTAPPRCSASRCRCSRARSSTRPCMHVAALREFLAAQMQRAKDDDVLFSVHLKATMMKVSDPIIFGHVVRAFFPDVFAQYGDVLAEAGLSPNDGLGGILKGIESLPQAAEIKAAFEPGHRRRPGARDGRLRQGDHQPARPERRHRRRLDAGDDPHLRPHVGPRRRGGRHPRGDPGLVVTPASTRWSSTTAAPTAPTTRRPWARSPTSA